MTEPTRRYTQADLLAEARERGYVVSSGQIERWVTLGLLDHAERRGLGRGRGVRWTWPETQRRLWLTLLDKRRATQQVRALANVPVAIWLYWGEAYVPLGQVRRALETYSEVGKAARRHDYRRAARSLVRSVARPGADPRAKSALVDQLVVAAQTRGLDIAAIAPLVQEVVGGVDPSAQLDGPRAIGMLQAQWAAVTRFFELTDAHFRWARAFLLYAQADYSQVRPSLASDPRFGAMHHPFDFEHLANSACQDVLFVLGMALLAPPAPQLPEPLQLDPWLQGRVHLDTSVEVVQSPLLLPHGVGGDRLAVDVTIRLDPPDGPP